MTFLSQKQIINIELESNTRPFFGILCKNRLSNPFKISIVDFIIIDSHLSCLIVHYPYLSFPHSIHPVEMSLELLVRQPDIQRHFKSIYQKITCAVFVQVFDIAFQGHNDILDNDIRNHQISSDDLISLHGFRNHRHHHPSDSCIVVTPFPDILS